MSNSLLHSIPSSARAWESARDEARDLDQFGANWDGEGAKPVPRDVIASVIHYFHLWEARGLSTPTTMFPLADGSVMIQWQHEGGAVDAVNVREDGKADVYLLSPEGEVVDFDLPPLKKASRPVIGATTASEDITVLGSICADGDLFDFALAA